jgi:hypothetical protein
MELTITSPHSRVDFNACIPVNPMPESALALCQSRLYPSVGDLDLASVEACYQGKYTFLFYELLNRNNLSGSQTVIISKVMNQISIKTLNPKCSIYWCLIEFTDWRNSQSCWYFRSLLWISAPLTFSLVYLPHPHPLPGVRIHTVCKGGGVGVRGPQRDKHLPPSTFTGQFWRKADI